ncbi:helix-turn-helix transcriptional regulator [Actinoplanes sp. NPDC051851]|uniref:helix-turn-helix domain-containing protein n=1 Tax=Actinoplanes sp. NPDC051851 TaxID=3154753 RepID=UPI0034313D55
MTIYRASNGADPTDELQISLLTSSDTRRIDAMRRDLQRQRNADPNRTATGALLAREHELARLRARYISGETAAAELAERLSFAHRHAGKPSLAQLSDKVGYSKGTLSKVLNGKMAPAWPLVRALGEQLRVPPQHITQEWLPLWIAASAYRDESRSEKRGTQREESGGYTCPKCGSWVVSTALHTEWHMRQEPSGRPAPAAELTGTGLAEDEVVLLRRMYHGDRR